MEYLSGHELPTLERKTLEISDEEIAVVKKVHTQLTDIIMELGIFIDVFVCVTSS
jgi:phage-related protein